MPTSTPSEQLSRMLAARLSLFRLVRQVRALQTKAYRTMRATPAERKQLYSILLPKLDTILQQGAEQLLKQGIIKHDTKHYDNEPDTHSYISTEAGNRVPPRYQFFYDVLVMRKYQLRIQVTGQTFRYLSGALNFQEAVDRHLERGETYDQLIAAKHFQPNG